LYDPVKALRSCRAHGRSRAAVALLREVAMAEEAVELALEFDPDLAAAIARSAPGDEAQRRRLWMTIARRAAAAGPAEGKDDAEARAWRVAEVARVVEASRGAVGIEDVLPFFPDFVEIDALRDAVCRSLERYSAEVEALRREMATSAGTAQAIREDLARLDLRGATLDESEPCARCGRSLHRAPPATAGPSGGSLPRLYLFPTGNAFHGSCLCAEVASLGPEVQRRRVTRLQARLAATMEGAASVPAFNGEPAMPVEEVRGLLNEEVAVEDPFCGEIVVSHISKPFVLPEEAALEASWVV
jgi:vacuolar protein sorting-associated protein 18